MNDAKGCLKCTLIIMALMSLVVFVFSLVVDAGEKYKSFAELHPYKALESGIAALGGTATINGVKYRVMAEAKHPEKEIWVQWIDAGEFDDVCDYAIMFVFMDDGEIGAEAYSCERAAKVIEQYCLENGVSINDVFHIAEPLIPSKPEIEA